MPLNEVPEFRNQIKTSRSLLGTQQEEAFIDYWGLREKQTL
jgi:hypothetical protein